MDNIHCYFGLALDSIVFGLILRDYYRLRKFTKSVKESKDLELKSLTQDDSKRYCAIRGTVRPIGLPLSSSMVPNASGVFQRIKLKEHAVIRAFGGYWTEQTKAIHTINQSIPFKLTNETVEIEIIEAISAEIIDMDLIFDNYEPATLDLLDHIFSFFSGFRQRGVQTTDHILRDGSFITAIGELEFDGKSWRLSPSDAGPMILTTATKNTIIKRFEDLKNASMFKLIMCGTIAVAIIAVIARKSYKKRISRYHDRNNKKKLDKIKKVLADEECSGDRSWWHRP